MCVAGVFGDGDEIHVVTHVYTSHPTGERVLVVSPGRAGSGKVAALAAVLKEATGVEPYWCVSVCVIVWCY